MLSALFIISVSLMMTLFSEKVLISNRCISGLMSNLIKKSWTDSNVHMHYAGQSHVHLNWCEITDLIPNNIWCRITVLKIKYIQIGSLLAGQILDQTNKSALLERCEFSVFLRYSQICSLTWICWAAHLDRLKNIIGKKFEFCNSM